MRRARLKPENTALFYHVYNHVAGDPGDLPFGAKEKAVFVKLLHKMNVFFSVKVVCYQVMSNHFHLVVHAPGEAPERDEVCRRYNAYYRGKRTLDPADPRCEELGRRMRDISWYMHALEQQFSTWFNRTRPTRRMGSLWAGRFKHTLLGDACAVWACCKYVEMNSVRAGLVRNPADYRYSSFGAWSGAGCHPFEENVKQVLLPWLEGIYPFGSPTLLYKSMRDTFAEYRGARNEVDDEALEFWVQVDRRVRYWVDGLVIGSELFVQDMINRHRHILRPRKGGLTRARDSDSTPSPLHCYKQLRMA